MKGRRTIHIDEKLHTRVKKHVARKPLLKDGKKLKMFEYVEDAIRDAIRKDVDANKAAKEALKTQPAA